ncbi:hypothetical protein [Leptospira dzoumogneensis]|uniref:DUF1574 domain-containing protein n=1 Tax=Leptospira dzoumogneensis TaxID=2484904 RepID=A0A4Z1AXE5_9LEPT|nr:hypothetical protein [Leptospira dzoumogneensis]TGN02326.1 hypothetical protein EHR06_05650 [Leptospira dzoumogneensis]
MSRKTKILLVFVSCILGFLFIDRFLFQSLLFSVPNEMEWDTSPWYNFLRKRKEIRFSEKENGVLLLGSSIALYSVLPDVFSNKVNRTLPDTEKIRTEFYSHPSLTPSDFYYYKEDIASKKPKAVVYLINPADFQLEFLKETVEGIEYDEKGFLEESIRIRHQNRLLYPDLFLEDHWKEIYDLDKSQLESFVSKLISYGVRYRSFFYDPVMAWYMHRFRWGRSYHYYTGVIPKEGIYLRGWVKPEFEIDCEISGNQWRESIFIQNPGTNLKIYKTSPKEELLFDKTYAKKGWYYLELTFSEKLEKLKLKFQSDKPVSSLAVDYRIFGTEEIYGIRLSQNFCRSEFRENLSYIRIPGIDDSRLESMASDQYDKDYDLRIYRKNDEENVLNRFKKIKNAKVLLSKQKSFVSWSQMKYLNEGIRYLSERNIPVLLINSPENPKEKSVYSNSPWYFGYLEFLEKISEVKYGFLDASDLFDRKQHFMDPHHLTYSSSVKASEKFADWFSRYYRSGFFHKP